MSTISYVCFSWVCIKTYQKNYNKFLTKLVIFVFDYFIYSLPQTNKNNLIKKNKKFHQKEF